MSSPNVMPVRVDGAFRRRMVHETIRRGAARRVSTAAAMDGLRMQPRAAASQQQMDVMFRRPCGRPLQLFRKRGPPPICASVEAPPWR